MTSSVAVGSAGSRAIQWRDSSTRSPACAHRPTFVWEWPARQGTTVENVSRVQRARQILRMGRAHRKAGGESRPPQPRRRACQRRKRILGLRASRAGTWGVLRAVDRRMLRQADDARRDRGAPCERGRVHAGGSATVARTRETGRVRPPSLGLTAEPIRVIGCRASRPAVIASTLPAHKGNFVGVSNPQHAVCKPDEAVRGAGCWHPFISPKSSRHERAASRRRCDRMTWRST
jgi:hypothetical protein